MQNQLNAIRNLVLDMDGVLWRGNTPLPGLKEFFLTTEELGINTVLATNNATKLARQYVAKLAGFGVDFNEERVITAAEATASFMAGQFGLKSRVAALGAPALYEALRAVGFTIVDSVPDVVVVGLKRDVTYRELALVCSQIIAGAAFIGTNPDTSYPSENGLQPGAGALLEFVKAVTRKDPLVIGKPGQAMFTEAMGRIGARVEDTAMVGDRIETDIVGAHEMGMSTILLLTGISSRSSAEQGALKPDYVFEGLPALASALRASRSNNKQAK